MSLYPVPHRYPTRYQAKRQLDDPLTYLENMSRLNLLMTTTQISKGVNRIRELTKLYKFVQTFQVWRLSQCLRNTLQDNIHRLLNDEIPIEMEKVMTVYTDIKMEDALFELEDTLNALDEMMAM
jgi:ribosomal protein S8